MIVALDATYSLGAQPSGVAVYCSRIIGAMARGAHDEEFLLCYRANRFFRGLVSPLPAPNCSRRLLEKPLYFLIHDRAAIFHGLNQRLPRCRWRRSVTTFHDLFVLTGDYSTPEFRKRFTALARDAAERSDHIITVSHYTADQVVGHLGYPRAQITVIHHGVDSVPEFPASELQQFRRRHSLEAPILLHVGALQVRKNIGRLVAAFERLNTDCLLVLAGSFGHGSELILKQIEASPARHRIRVLGYVGQRFLAKLYRTATALVFPSLEEGFGLPILEAMSAGLPVVTSNRSALSEVAGSAALMVDPEQVEELHLALERVVHDAEFRQRLISAGYKRATEFSWEKAASATLATYRRIQKA